MLNNQAVMGAKYGPGNDPGMSGKQMANPREGKVEVGMKEALGDRMKENYENRYRYKLVRRTPVIIRLDGKAFHTLTRKCEKPFDDAFRVSMSQAASNLCRLIQGAKCAYVQSDEISILLVDYDNLDTEAWFDYNLQKIVSVSASMASVTFSTAFERPGLFDSRAFNIPREEVANYFVWRQKDWIRNSVQMLAQSLYSHKELHHQGQSAMHELIHLKGKNWANLDPVWKNGVFIRYIDGESWQVEAAPIFTQAREAVETYVYPELAPAPASGGI